MTIDGSPLKVNVESVEAVILYIDYGEDKDKTRASMIYSRCWDKIYQRVRESNFHLRYLDLNFLICLIR